MQGSYETYDKYKDTAMLFHKQNQDAVIEWFNEKKLNIDPVPEDKEKSWAEKMAVGFRLTK